MANKARHKIERIPHTPETMHPLYSPTSFSVYYHIFLHAHSKAALWHDFSWFSSQPTDEAVFAFRIAGGELCHANLILAILKSWEQLCPTKHLQIFRDWAATNATSASNLERISMTGAYWTRMNKSWMDLDDWKNWSVAPRRKISSYLALLGIDVFWSSFDGFRLIFFDV